MYLGMLAVTDPGHCSVQGRVTDIPKAWLGLLHSTEQVVNVPSHPGWSEPAFPQYFMGEGPVHRQLSGDAAPRSVCPAHDASPLGARGRAGQEQLVLRTWGMEE